jgi:hypothetical protein
MASNEQTSTALQTLAQAHGQAEVAVTGAADAHEAFRIATELARAFREVADEVARLRAPAAVRIRNQESLSLRGLADKIGVSPARAEQLVKEAGKNG